MIFVLLLVVFHAGATPTVDMLGAYPTERECWYGVDRSPQKGFALACVPVDRP